MVNNIIECLGSKLKELYPETTIYDEKVPQEFKKPSFFLKIIKQDYSKRIGQKYKSKISFDIAYFSNAENINNDILNVQERLFREFDLLGNGDFKIRILNKNATINNDVLHFLFGIKYFETKIVGSQVINKLDEINSNIRE